MRGPRRDLERYLVIWNQIVALLTLFSYLEPNRSNFAIIDVIWNQIVALLTLFSYLEPNRSNFAII